MQSEEEKEYIAYYASRTEPEGWYTEKEKRIIKKEQKILGWRILLMILFWPYAMYRSWRGINQANKLLGRKQKIIREKYNKGEKLSREEQELLNKEKIGGLYKFLSLMIPPIYSIYRGVLGIKDENTLTELKKDEVIEKNKNKYTRYRVKASQIQADKNWIVERNANFSPEETARKDAKINAEKQRWAEEQKILSKTTSNINSTQPQRSLMTTSRQNNLCKEN